MPKNRRTLYATLIGSMLILASGCDISPCHYLLGTTVRSPDGSLQAGLMEPGCGATTGDTHWVLFGSTSKQLDKNSTIVAVFKGPIRALTWESGALVVHHGRSKPFTMVSLQQSTPILYRPD
jgi:hypothetical protein